MHCQHCGAQLASRSQPCMFCGRETRLEISNPLAGLPKAPVLVALALVLLVIGHQLLGSATYQPTSHLRAGKLGQAQVALSQGQTEEARRLCGGEYRKMGYSGIPGCVIALSYYRDYMTGDPSALKQARSYAKEAYNREKFFLTRYAYALILFEEGKYGRVIEEMDEAATSLRPIWDSYIHRAKWHAAFDELREAAREAQAGQPKKRGYYPRLDSLPQVPAFKVEMAV